MVQFIRQDKAIGQQFAEGGNGRLVGNIAGRKHQSRFFVVQIGQFALQFHNQMVRAGNIARAACASAHIVNGAFHGIHNVFILTDAEIIIGAPNGNFARRRHRIINGAGKSPARRAKSVKTR